MSIDQGLNGLAVNFPFEVDVCHEARSMRPDAWVILAVRTTDQGCTSACWSVIQHDQVQDTEVRRQGGSINIGITNFTTRGFKRRLNRDGPVSIYLRGDGPRRLGSRS